MSVTMNLQLLAKKRRQLLERQTLKQARTRELSSPYITSLPFSMTTIVLLRAAARCMIATGMMFAFSISSANSFSPAFLQFVPESKIVLLL